MKLNLMIIWAFTFSVISYAHAGGVNGGGGDPKAYDFIAFGKEVASWLETNAHPDIDVNTEKLWDYIRRLERTLAAKPPALPAIEFKDAATIKCFDADKAGCTFPVDLKKLSLYKSDLRIEVATKDWLQSTIFNRCTLVAMELFLPQIKNERYRKATSVCAKVSEKLGGNMITAPSQPAIDAKCNQIFDYLSRNAGAQVTESIINGKINFSQQAQYLFKACDDRFSLMEIPNSFEENISSQGGSLMTSQEVQDYFLQNLKKSLLETKFPSDCFSYAIQNLTKVGPARRRKTDSVERRLGINTSSSYLIRLDSKLLLACRHPSMRLPN